MLAAAAMVTAATTAAIAQSATSSQFAAGSRQTPPWKMEYFEGDASCEALAKVLDAVNAAQWKILSAAQPVQRPVRIWIRLSSDTRILLEPAWVVAIDRQLVRQVLFGLTPSTEMQRRFTNQPMRPYELSSQAFAVALPQTLEPQQPWYFCLASAPTVTSAAFSLVPAATFREADLFNAQRIAACIAVMLTMMLSAVFFGTRLRDSVYLWYSGHVAGFLAFQATSTGLMSRWLDFLPDGWRWVWLAQVLGIGVSVFCATHFISAFLSVAQVLPRTDCWLRRLAWTTLAATITLVAFQLVFVYWPGVATISAIGNIVQNALTAIACLLALATCAYLAIKGRRFALYLLVGWMPLLALSILSAMEIISGATTRIVEPWLLPAAAFEALILSAGMAARTLDLRNERDAARMTAELDPLTGALNRRGLFNRLERLERLPPDARGGASGHALLYCDLDFFKRINDEHGHDAGDACLQHFVACAQSVLSNEDVIGRIGGEEFVMLLRARDRVQAAAVAERLRGQLHASPVVWRDRTIPLTVSIGVARIEGETRFEAALSKADAALYRAKEGGRDRVHVDEVIA